MKHTCHWPGCKTEVLPKLWGCPPHWYALPKALRDRIWATYRAGQEITKTPSAAYVTVAQKVRVWCLEQEMRAAMPRFLEKRGDQWWATEASARSLEAFLAERGLDGLKIGASNGRFTFETTGNPNLGENDGK